MGTIIGRQGQKIKQIQDASGARMVASKEMLPQSTERVVEVQGNVEAIKHALKEIATCVLEDWERAQGTVPYHPGAAGDQGVLAGGLGAQTVTGPTGGIRRSSLVTGPFGLGDRRQSRAAPMPGGDRRQSEGGALSGLANGLGNLNINPFAAANGANPAAVPFAPGYPAGLQNGQHHAALSPMTANYPIDPLTPSSTTSFGQSITTSAPPAPAGNLKTQNISIPSDMVGCIIGRAGSKITEIRRLSGSRISIAKNPHDESGERMFTIVGSAEANEKALYLLYSQLEIEKQRRVSAGAVGGEAGSPSAGGFEHGA
jgi:heterogeneous nuclear rnp K-like protein 2